MNVRHLYTFLLTIIILSSLLRLLGAIFALIIIVCSIGLMILSLLQNRNLIINNKLLLIYFFCYTFCTLIAAVIHQDKSVFENAIFSIFIFISIAIIFNSSAGDEAVNIAFRATLIAYIPFIILCFILNPNYNEPFKGVYTNQNSMGLAMLGLFIVILTKLYSMLYSSLVHGKSMNIIKFLFYIILYCIGLYVIFLSNSRTSLLAVVVGTLIVGIVLFVKMKKSIKSIIKGFSIFSIIIVSVLLCIIKIPLLNEAFNSILLKYQLQSSSDRLTSGRVDIWKMVLDNVTLWGSGNEAFSKLGISHAHNIFLNILQEVGLIAVIFYLIFIISLLILGIKLILNYKFKPESIIIIIAISFYVIAGMFEAFDYHILILYIYLASGYCNTLVTQNIRTNTIY